MENGWFWPRERAPLCSIPNTAMKWERRLTSLSEVKKLPRRLPQPTYYSRSQALGPYQPCGTVSIYCRSVVFKDTYPPFLSSSQLLPLRSTVNGQSVFMIFTTFVASLRCGCTSVTCRPWNFHALNQDAVAGNENLKSWAKDIRGSHSGYLKG